MDFTPSPGEASVAGAKVGGRASQDLEGATQSGLDKASKAGESGSVTTIETQAEVGKAQVPAAEIPMSMTNATVKAKVVVAKVKRVMVPMVGADKDGGSMPFLARE